MNVIEPRTADDELTDQERECIRGLIRKGCDVGEVCKLFGLVDGELEEIVNEEERK